MAKAIIGLGNPGNEYTNTRHNIGWLVIDQLSFAGQLIWKQKFKGEYAIEAVKGEKVYFLKPQTYMNLSGESVQPMLSFFKLDIADMLVLHDELDLPFGKIAFKDGGGLAGHNGLKSISNKLNSKNYKRLRLGIDRPKHGDVSSWVLSKFSSDEEITLERYLAGAAEATEDYIQRGFSKAASKFSNKIFS